ncbi:ATP-binding protein [uncultured Oscillibacter sp.]|uniref:ATP-binding protein n=1 Tax=uncultured Oscillibacter sp. TaxID=876091 RepID=UPI0025F1F654|nr:AAA family ATPase [uncultured Oscillibacter sp.]
MMWLFEFYETEVIYLRIHRMSATFGKLSQRTLHLSDGLNIIQAPNETGKSTWCAFLLSMLYGINSRERDRVGFIADKNRYAPWSGAAMAGRLDCRIGGNELTLLRETKRQTAPLGDFKAVRAGTMDEYPGLTGQNCGETLLGVSREVYERSAFIRQAGLPVTQDAGLEKRIAALITTGEEDTSYSEAAAALNKQLNRRRHNKTGRLPALELELADTVSQLEALTGAEAQLSDQHRELSRLTEQEAELSRLLKLHDLWDASKERRLLSEAEDAAEAAEQTAVTLRRRAEEARLPENETIGRLRGAIVNLETVRKSVNAAMAEKDAAMKAGVKAETAVSESPFAGRTAEEAHRVAQNAPPIRPKTWWFPILLLAVGAGGTFLLSALNGEPYPLWAFATMGGIGFLLGIYAVFSRERGDRKKQTAYLAAYGASSAEDLAALADDYAAACRRRDEAQNAVVKATATYDALYASLTSNEQGILLEVRRFAPAAFDIPAADAALRECAVRRRELTVAENAAEAARLRYETMRRQIPEQTAPVEEPSAPPTQSRETLNTELLSAKAALSAAQSASDRLTGQIAALGGREALEAQTEQLRLQIDVLEGEYQSIALAMETLDDANAALQNRFSPLLGRRTAELFSSLTDGAYSGVVLDRSFRLSAEPTGDTVWRDAGLLSTGAGDQLYLAARLAICELVLPDTDPPPLVLDDALANFDDSRCASALRLLKEEGKKRQLLLFTCHSREAAFFADDPEVSVQRLTNDPSEV